MLVAAIKADALSPDDLAKTPPAGDATPSPGDETTPGVIRRTASAAVMSSTYSYTLLKRAQLSSIWNASDVSAERELESYCALAHTSLVALVKTANDAREARDFSSYPALQSQHSDVDFKCREDFESPVLVAAIDIAAAQHVVCDLVAMGSGGEWNAVFDGASHATTLDSTSLAVVLSTLRMKSAAVSFRVLQACNNALQSAIPDEPSQTIIALRSVGPLSAANHDGPDLSQGRHSGEQLLSGFVVDTLDGGHSRIACVSACRVLVCCPLVTPLAVS
jgi:hypothetical protein